MFIFSCCYGQRVGEIHVTPDFGIDPGRDKQDRAPAARVLHASSPRFLCKQHLCPPIIRSYVICNMVMWVHQNLYFTCTRHMFKVLRYLSQVLSIQATASTVTVVPVLWAHCMMSRPAGGAGGEPNMLNHLSTCAVQGVTRTLVSMTRVSQNLAKPASLAYI